MTLPKNQKSFVTFINELLQIPHFVSLNFDLGYASAPLNPRQTQSLATAVIQAKYLTTLTANIPDTEVSANIFADMIKKNSSLIIFRCNITDDAYDYSILKAAVQTNNNLRKIHLSCTDQPMFSFPVKQTDIANRNLQIIFEGDKKLNISSILPQSSSIGQKRQRADKDNVTTNSNTAVSALQPPIHKPRLT